MPHLALSPGTLFRIQPREVMQSEKETEATQTQSDRAKAMCEKLAKIKEGKDSLWSWISTDQKGEYFFITGALANDLYNAKSVMEPDGQKLLYEQLRPLALNLIA
jgi:hypothetical protein